MNISASALSPSSPFDAGQVLLYNMGANIDRSLTSKSCSIAFTEPIFVQSELLEKDCPGLLTTRASCMPFSRVSSSLWFFPGLSTSTPFPQFQVRPRHQETKSREANCAIVDHGYKEPASRVLLVMAPSEPESQKCFIELFIRGHRVRCWLSPLGSDFRLRSGGRSCSSDQDMRPAPPPTGHCLSARPLKTAFVDMDVSINMTLIIRVFLDKSLTIFSSSEPCPRSRSPLNPL